MDYIFFMLGNLNSTILDIKIKTVALRSSKMYDRMYMIEL